MYLVCSYLLCQLIMCVGETIVTQGYGNLESAYRTRTYISNNITINRK